MMVSGEWQVGPGHIAQFQPELDYGVAPFPPPADHPERGNTAVVQGAVAVLPAGGRDKEAAAHLLAWMMSPEVMAEATHGRVLLPARRTAAQDPRFQGTPGLEVFAALMAHPNAVPGVTMPNSLEVNEALGGVEDEVLHSGGDPALLLGEVQARLAPKLAEAAAHHAGP